MRLAHAREAPRLDSDRTIASDFSQRDAVVSRLRRYVMRLAPLLLAINFNYLDPVTSAHTIADTNPPTLSPFVGARPLGLLRLADEAHPRKSFRT